MRRATYGRMRIGKCIEAEEDVLANGNDPRYLGCSVDVLDILDSRCSGEAQCDVSVNDQELGNTKPCYKSLRMHLEASYSCAGGELHSSVASGIHYLTICVLFLQHHLLKPTTLSSHCLPLNSTNNSKPTFSFNPILPRLSPPRTDILELDSAWFTRHSHSISFFIHQHIIHRLTIFFVIHDVVSVPEKADRNEFLSALWCTLNLPHFSHY